MANNGTINSLDAAYFSALAYAPLGWGNSILWGLAQGGQDAQCAAALAQGGWTDQTVALATKYGVGDGYNTGLNAFRVFVNSNTHQVVFAFKGSSLATPTNYVADFVSTDEGYSQYASIQAAANVIFADMKLDVATYGSYSFDADGHSLGGGMAQTFALQNKISGFGQNSLPIASQSIHNFFADNWSGAYSDYVSAGATFKNMALQGDPATALYATYYSGSGGQYLGTTQWLANPMASEIQPLASEITFAASLPNGAASEAMLEASLIVNVVHAHRLENFITAALQQLLPDGSGYINGTAPTADSGPLQSAISSNLQPVLDRLNSLNIHFNPDGSVDYPAGVFGVAVSTILAPYSPLSSPPIDVGAKAPTSSPVDGAVGSATQASTILASGTGNILYASGGPTILQGSGGSFYLCGTGNATVYGGGGGGDTFEYLNPNHLPNASMTVAKSNVSDFIFVGDTQLTGGSPTVTSNVWTDGNGTTYQFNAGQAFSQNGVGTLIISGGVLGTAAGDVITIQDFNLSLAQGASGYMGIRFSETLALSALSGATGNGTPTSFASGSEQFFVVSLSAPTSVAQTVTVTASGISTDKFLAATSTGTVALNPDGTFSVIIPAGQVRASFSLENTSDDPQSSAIRVSASVANPSDSNAPPITATPIAEAYVPSSYTPVIPTNNITGITVPPNGSNPGYTLFRNDGQADVMLGAAGPNSMDATYFPFNFNNVSDSIVGNTGPDSVYGGFTGNETVVGGGGADLIFAGQGNNQIFAQSQTSLPIAIANANSGAGSTGKGDLLIAGNGNNTLVGGSGDDGIVVGTGNNTVILGPGNSVFVGGVATYYSYLPAFGTLVPADANWSITTNGANGVTFTGDPVVTADIVQFVNPGPQPYNGALTFNVVDSLGNPLTLYGGPGNDTIYAGSGTDYLLLSNGNNELHAGSGAEYIWAGMGNNSITGGTGNDTVHGGGGNLYVNMISGNDSIYGGVGNNTVYGGSGNDLISMYPIGTFAGQTLATNFVFGGSGNDTIYGSAGSDTLIAGSSSSTIYGGSGNESIVGGAGDDVLAAGSGNNTIYAGAGNDTIYGNNGTVTLNGGSGSDSIYGSTGTTLAYAGDGGTALAPTQVVASSGNTTIYGGNGVDELWGGSGSNVLYAGNGGTSSGATSVTAGAGATTIYGGLGTDALYGGTGPDVIYAGDGGQTAAPTTVVAGTGAATIFGGAGPAILQDAVSGQDLIYGGTSNDTLIGMGADTLVAGSANQTIQSDGGGVTVLFGPGSGSDTIIADPFTVNLAFASGMTVTDFTTSVSLDSSYQPVLTLYGDGGSVVLKGGFTGALGGVSFADSGVSSVDALLSNSTSDQTVVGASGNFILSLGSGASINGGAGNDTISSFGANATIHGGSAYSTIYSAGNAASIASGTVAGTVTATGNNDTITASQIGDTVSVSGANALVTGTALFTTQTAAGHADTLVGAGGDSFTISDSSTVILEGAYSVASVLNSSVSYTLPNNVNTLYLTGTSAISGTGNAGNDSMYSGDANTTLVAGTGIATMYAGRGNDAFVVNNASDVVQGSPIGGSDTILSSVGFTLPTYINTLILTGSSNLVGTGNFDNDTLVSNTGVDTLVGASGSTTQFVVNNSADIIQQAGGATNSVVQSAVGFSLPTNVNVLVLTGTANVVGTGNAANDSLVGNSGLSTLVAGAGIDTLVAGTGLTTLVGGSGTDTFVVNNSADVVSDTFASTASLILSTASYSLPTNVNTLVLSGTANISGTGNAGADTITAGTGNDTLVAGTGLATLIGGLGNDTFVVNNTADVIQDTSTTATNTLMSSVTFTAPTNVNIVQLTGTANLSATTNSGNDSLVGNSGNDTLVATTGVDTLTAGTGRATLIGGTNGDTFVVNSTADVIVATSTTVANTLYSSVSYTLPANVDTLWLTGSANLVATGNADTNNYMHGNDGNDTLIAGSGRDTLVAGSNAGLTTLIGGGANDTFSVHHTGDVVIDTFTSTSNTLYASVSYTAPTNVNSLILLGTDNLKATANSGNDTLVANSGVDTLIGGSGNDTFVISNSLDVVVDTSLTAANVVQSSVSYVAPTNVNTLVLTGPNNITATGNGGSDSLVAGNGADTLIAGSGVATLVGGAGNDTFVVNNTADVVVDATFTTNNFILSSVSYTAPTNVNTLVLTGTANLKGTANAGNDTLVSNSGIDTLVGSTGNDTFVVSNSLDVVQDTSTTANNSVSSSVSYVAPTNVNTLTLTGTANLTATANSGNDTLVSNSGADTLIGGAGNDTFVVNNALDVVQDTSTTATNVVRSAVSYTAPNHVNTLVLTGLGNISATGNGAADSLVAGDGVDTLVAGTGIATLVGGRGSDTFVVNNTADVVVDTLSTTNNSLQTSVSYTAPTNVNTLVLTGTANLKGTANAGNDTLVSNSGIDTLVGSTGNDTFVVSNSLDVVQDTSTTANNSVSSSVSYVAPTNVNTLTLTGTANLTATANSGNDTLVSNSGADTLIGGAGNDTFVVNNALDVVQDTSTTATNVVRSAVSYTAPNHVNTLVLTGTSSISATGNSAADSLVAGAGLDTLVAGSGVASLVGGGGNDTFVINNTADVVQDTFTTTSNTLQSSVSYSLPTNVNTLVLTGTATVVGTANSANDTLISSAGVNTLVAGAGNDLFIVNNTADVVTVGATHGNDTIQSAVSFAASTNVATLTLTGSANIVGTGNSSPNVITANAGADTLVAGSGVATLVGGSGNDTFVVNNVADVVTDNYLTTTNTIKSSVSYSLPSNVDTLVLTGSAALTATGNGDLANVLTANSGNDVLNGKAFANTINGGSGADTINAGFGTNLIYSGNGGTGPAPTVVNGDAVGTGIWTQSTIYGGTGVNILRGGPGSDLIYGGTGTTQIFAGTGLDTLYGNSGATLYDSNGGLDLLVAGSGSETLNATGADTLVAGTGNDTLYAPGTSTVELNAGFAQDFLSAPTTLLPNIVLGTGIAPSNLQFSGTVYGDLVLTVGSGAVTLSGGLKPGVLGGISFVDSGAANFTQLIAAYGPGEQFLGGLGDFLTSSGQVRLGDNVLDQFYVFGNSDYISAYGGTNFNQNGNTIDIYGNNDVVYAGGGNDAIDLEGTGDVAFLTPTTLRSVTVNGASETVYAGAGNKSFVVGQSSDVIVVTPGAGNDTVNAATNYTLPANVGTLYLSGPAHTATSNAVGGSLEAFQDAETLIGGAGHDTLSADGNNDLITAGSGTEILNAYGNYDTLVGGAGNDTFYLANTTDVAQFGVNPALNTVQSTFNYTLTSGANVLTLMGSGLSGTANGAADTLTASSDTDTLIGGAGNDVFVVTDTSDVVVDTYSATNNILQSSVSYSLPIHVNTLILTGAGSAVATANSANDSLVGNAGTDTLIAGSGNDTLAAGTGVDTLVAGAGVDVLQGASTGGDTFVFNTGFGTAQIVGVQNGDGIVFGAGISQASLTFSGLPGSGGSAPSLVISKAGEAITVQGGLVPGALSGITFTGVGTQTVQQVLGLSGRQTITGSGGNLILSAGASDSVNGGTGQDTIVAWGSGDTLTAGSGGALIYAGGTTSKVTGGASNDTLVAIGATDTLVGGSGNETLVVNNATAVVQVSAGVGHDTVMSSVTYTVPTNVTVMTLTGVSNIQGTGNAGADVITGNAGNDTLIAGVGVDTLVSGSGNDLFQLNNTGDVVQNTFTSNNDTIQSSVSYTLPANVNTLVLTGTSALTATGNSGNDSITGNTGNDTLIAGSGNTTLVAGTGKVSLVGGSGLDRLVAGGGTDTLVAGTGLATLVGGSGSDLFIVNNSGDVVVGSTYADTINASASLTLNGNAVVNLTGTANIVATDPGFGAQITGNAGNDTLISYGLYSQLTAGTGVDTLIGGSNITYVVNNTADVVQAVAGSSGSTLNSSVSYSLPQYVDQLTLTGTANIVGTANNDASATVSIDVLATGHDTLIAGSGNDQLIGGASGTIQTMIAGTGSDTLSANTGSTFVLNTGFGNDQLIVSTPGSTGTATVQFGAGVTPASLTASVVLDQSGNAALAISNGTGTATLVGALSNITYQFSFSGGGTLTLGQFLSQINVLTSSVVGGTGNTILEGTPSVSLAGGSGNDTIYAGATSDTITAGTGNQALYALGANDSIVGGSGADTLTGLGTNDTLVAAAITNTLVGGTGATVMFVVNNTADKIQLQASPGSDSISSSVTYALPTNVNTLILTGTTAIKGTANAGNDTLTANANAQSLVGGAGNELFIVGATGVIVTDTSTTANNTLQSSVSYSLPTHVNMLVLTGTAALKGTANSGTDTLTSNSGVDTLVGGSGNDTFVLNNTADIVTDTSTTASNTIQAGFSYTLPTNINSLVLTGTANLTGRANAANDTLTSNTGVDTLVGGAGNDTFVVNNTADVVTDTSTTATNTIQASVTYSLPTNVNTLVLTGTAALKGTANAGNDTLTSNTGVDTLVGGAGNETFVVNNAADMVTDTSTTASNVLQSSVTYTLPTNVNAMVLTGTAAIAGTGNAHTNTLTAGSGIDTLIAGAGVATMTGGSGNDTFVVNNTADVVTDTWTTTSNTLSSSVSYSLPTNINTLVLTGTAALKGTANAGADTLTSNTGVDTLVGSTGNDTFVVNNTADVVTDTSTTANNTIQSSVNYVLPINVNTLVLTGTAALSGTGNTHTNSLTANSGADTLTAGTGVATMVGGGGNDTFVVNNTADVVTDTWTTTNNSIQSSVNYSLPTHVNTLILTGTAALKGTANAGADTLTANSGADTLVGGAGNDTFVISNTAAVVQDTFTTTSNSISSSVSYSLPVNINTLNLTGTSALKGTANAGNDTLTSNTGVDTLVGGAGNDTFVVNNTADVVTDTSTTATNTIQASVTYSLPTNVNTLVLTGTAALKGTANAGNDTLTSNTGVDTLVGGAGNETFVVNNAADMVTDTSTTASNVLQSSVTYTLPTNVNAMVLTGTAAIAGTGNAHTNTLTAGSGIDTLIAGAGVATMTGGSGNDTFVVNNTADVVTDTWTTTSNTLSSSVSYSLPTNVNTLILTGTAALKGTANSGTDTLTSNTGIDTLVGGTGLNTFIVNNSADVVTVTATGLADTIQSSVNYVLPTNVQYLMLTGTANLTGTGNSLTDLIVGNTGNDTLTGGTGIAVLEGGKTAGQDLLQASQNQAALIAGGGASTLTGGAFKDFFAAGAVSDSITTGATTNVVAVNKGDGATTLLPTTSASNVLSLGAGIDTESLFFTKSGNNLLLTDGAGDTITFSNWYASSNNQNYVTLQVVEIASASYNGGGGDGLRNKPLEEFNFTSLVSQFNAAGSPSNWALSNGMPTAAITSSATTAYGGDLAYYYGINGNLTGMNLSAAQSTLTNASYATGLQTIDSWGSISSGGGLQLALARPGLGTSALIAGSSSAAEQTSTPQSIPPNALVGLRSRFGRTLEHYWQPNLHTSFFDDLVNEPFTARLRSSATGTAPPITWDAQLGWVPQHRMAIGGDAASSSVPAPQAHPMQVRWFDIQPPMLPGSEGTAAKLSIAWNARLGWMPRQRLEIGNVPSTPPPVAAPYVHPMQVHWFGVHAASDQLPAAGGASAGTEHDAVSLQSNQFLGALLSSHAEVTQVRRIGERELIVRQLE